MPLLGNGANHGIVWRSKRAPGTVQATEDARACKLLLLVGCHDVRTRRDEGRLSFLICEMGIIITRCFHSPLLLFTGTDVPVNVGRVWPCPACGYVCLQSLLLRQPDLFSPAVPSKIPSELENPHTPPFTWGPHLNICFIGGNLVKPQLPKSLGTRGESVPGWGGECWAGEGSGLFGLYNVNLYVIYLKSPFCSKSCLRLVFTQSTVEESITGIK